jgi:hypothetical protein
MHDEFQVAVGHAMLARVSAPFGSTNRFPNTEVINTIYEGTTTGSSARKVMVDLVCRNGTLDMLDGKAPTAVWHEDFVNDALTAFLTYPLLGSRELTWSQPANEDYDYQDAVPAFTPVNSGHTASLQESARFLTE